MDQTALHLSTRAEKQYVIGWSVDSPALGRTWVPHATLQVVSHVSVVLTVPSRPSTVDTPVAKA